MTMITGGVSKFEVENIGTYRSHCAAHYSRMVVGKNDVEPKLILSRAAGSVPSFGIDKFGTEMDNRSVITIVSMFRRTAK